MERVDRHLLARWKQRRQECNSRPAPAHHSISEGAQALRERWTAPRMWIYTGIFLALVVGFLWQASIFWPMTIDDAYISFRYALNLVNGHGLRYSVSLPPVEGFSNFSWVMLSAAALKLGLDVMLVAKLLGLLSTASIMATVWSLARLLRGRDDVWNLLAPAFMAFNASAARWSLLGLETQFAVLLVVYTYYRFAKEVDDPRSWIISPWIASLAAMTRFDSLFYFLPLGLYGAALVIGGWVPLRRLVVWAVIAATTFGIYYGWKVWYFGDLLPNTYYAKHRLVTDVDRTRGVGQLRAFYLAHAVPKQVAASTSGPPGSRPALSPLKGARYWAPDGWFQSPWWIAWWSIGLLLLILRPRARLLMLVPLPLLLNAYYVYYTNGDWMPNFRFLQIAVPFLALLGPLGIDCAQTAAGLLRRTRWPVCALFLAAVIGSSLEQTQIRTVDVWGSKARWYARQEGWSTLQAMLANYHKGFAPPLPRVADWLQLNSQDGASIFMGDIGWPMWIASHLNCLPFEGLTDKYLGDAPSVRGELLSLEEHIERTFEESKSDEVPNSEGRDRHLLQIAQKSYTSEHTARDVDYVMRKQRPEYLLLFVRHQKNGDIALDRPILRAIYESRERREDYVLAAEVLKFKPNYNAIYRRKDVPVGISDRAKLDRLRQSIELNPRTYHQVILLYEQTEEMQDREISTEARAVVFERLPMLGRDPDEVRRLYSAAEKRGDKELMDALIDAAVEQRPHDPAILHMAAERSWQEGRKTEAITAVEEAVRRAPISTNQYHHALVQYYRVSGRWDEALDVANAAAERRPDDRGAWAGLAHLADLASRDKNRALRDRIALKRRAAEAFRQTDEIDRINGRLENQYLEKSRKLEREIAVLERQVDRR